MPDQVRHDEMVRRNKDGGARIEPVCTGHRRLSVDSHRFWGRDTAVADTSSGGQGRPIHPLFAFLLSGAVPLFAGALLSDLAYGSTAEIQWSNFAAWLLVGAMVLTGFALLWALIALVRARPRRGWVAICFALLLAAFGLGLVNAFVHARDAFAIMPAAPILSGIVSLVALLAAWAGLSSLRSGGTK
jgi:uncharacterized membrane protein